MDAKKTLLANHGGASLADENVEALRTMAPNDTLSCTRIFTFAKRHHVSLPDMKPLLQAGNIKLQECEQLCLSRRCEEFK